jgi:cytosine permease
MLISFLLVLLWMIVKVIYASDHSFLEIISFDSQLSLSTLDKIGVHSNLDKFVFVFNIEVGGACALALNNADFGRYSKSTIHAGIAATIGIFCQTMLMLIIGGMLMYAGETMMMEYYMNTQGVAVGDAQKYVLKNTDSIAATFIVFGGIGGFILMFLAQAKAQVLNCYSSSLCLSNLFDAVFNWRPGRLTFVIFANIIALLMLYGHILEYVEAWIKLIGVLLSSVATLIIMDYFVTAPRLNNLESENVNWAGVISFLMAIVIGHWLLKPYQPIEIFTAITTVVVLYPILRLYVLRPKKSTLIN